jgi:hypothetical protein
MNKLILVLTFLIIKSVSFSQKPNVAVIVDDEISQFDYHFISKICVMLFLGIVALFSYMKFRKSDG